MRHHEHTGGPHPADGCKCWRCNSERRIEKKRARQVDALAHGRATESLKHVVCRLGRFEATLLANADMDTARTVIRRWGERLFRGATFEVTTIFGRCRTLTWPELARVFGVTVPKDWKPSKTAPAIARAPEPKLEATRAPVASRPGRVPVRKEILHRGRRFVVTYWTKGKEAA